MLTASFLFLIVGQPIQPSENNLESENKGFSVVTEDGIQLSVSIPEKNKVGIPIPVKLRVTNWGDCPVSCSVDRVRLFSFGLTIETVNGKSVPLTRFGRHELDPRSFGHRASIMDVDAKLNEPFEEDIEDLAKFYNLKPGKYTLRVSKGARVYTQRITKRVFMETAPIAFQVEKPK